MLAHLTNCLRIADLSEIEPDGRVWLREIKVQLRTDSRQMARAQAAIDAISNGGPLPGSDARFVELTTPYRTSIGSLRDAVRLARRDGVRGMKLTQGRALVIVSLLDARQRFKDDIDAAPPHHAAERSGAFKRAGITAATHHLTGVSADTACRSPHSVPWAIYPLAPEDCAALICDRMSFEVIVSVDELVARLTAHGLRTEVLLPEEHNHALPPDGDVLRVHWRDRALTFHNAGVGQLIYELLEPEAWAAGVAELLRMDDPPINPVTIYADEAARAGWR